MCILDIYVSIYNSNSQCWTVKTILLLSVRYLCVCGK